MSKDKDYIRLIHNTRWLNLRKHKLTASPLCERCKAEGIIRTASEVHHVIPVESGISTAEKERLMYAPHNLKALCHDCHVKTHTEMGRSGKAATMRKNAERLKRFAEKFL